MKKWLRGSTPLPTAKRKEEKMGTMKEIKEKELIKSVRKYHKLEKEQKSIKNKLLRARIDYIEKKLLFEIEELNERIDRMHKCVPLKKD